ncbi:golgin subfamily A member 7-like isoform X1 [Antennarius striatus]|uniref:golgin subfamily A member 7-like isoform X1 n=1 Tax=Antennarius striatus TaxID=241820 RepID=UPI0035B2A375
MRVCVCARFYVCVCVCVCFSSRLWVSWVGGRLCPTRCSSRGTTATGPPAGSRCISPVERSLFEDTVKTLNDYYAEAEQVGGGSYLEGGVACATAYLIFLCMETRYEKVLRKVAAYIQEQNQKVYAPRGLLISDPVQRGMRVIEISIYDDHGSTDSSSGSSSVSGSTARSPPVS